MRGCTLFPTSLHTAVCTLEKIHTKKEYNKYTIKRLNTKLLSKLLAKECFHVILRLRVCFQQTITLCTASQCLKSFQMVDIKKKVISI